MEKKWLWTVVTVLQLAEIKQTARGEGGDEQRQLGGLIMYITSCVLSSTDKTRLKQERFERSQCLKHVLRFIYARDL